jgi:tyrosinase
LPYWKFDEPATKLFHREFIGVPNANWGIEFVAGNPLEFWVTDTLPGIIRIPFFNTDTQPAFVRSELQTMTLGGDDNLYADFVREMEGDPHGEAHGNFGGFLQIIHFAAKDPLFFLLHANVDRLWAKWQWLHRRFDTAKPATYPFLGSAGESNSERIGHNLLNDTMWPWNQVTGTGAPNDRPVTAPGGALAASPTTNAPGSMPRVGDMIDYQGVINQGNRLGFAYDDVEFLPPGP